MIIYTNEGNPLGLKLVLSAKFGGVDNVSVKIVNLNDDVIKEPKHLPILELDDGIQIFSTDAASKYLMGLGGEVASGLRDQWLEWSSTRLAPALTHNMAVGHRADPNALAALNSLVKALEDQLTNNKFLTGDKLTSADLSVWSLLAPDGTLKNSQNINHLLNWYKNILNTDQTNNALQLLNINNLHFKQLQQANNFGGLHHVVLMPDIGNMNVNLISEQTRDSLIVDTLSDEELQLAKNSFIFVVEKSIEEPRIILPKPNQRNILITSALPYVNNVPHLGNIIGCVLSADIFARYSRLCGHNTLYICGTDEYGTATETKALQENLTCKQICDKYYEIHNSIYRWFGIGFDYFGRTTTTEQTEIVQSMFNELYDAGLIETQIVEQLLCQKCDRFLADRFVEGTCPYPGCNYDDARGDQCDNCGKLINAVELIRPRCKQCNTTPIICESKQFFINLPKIEPKLREWITSVEGNWTSNSRTITRSWLKEGLKSRCITRDLKWGIPVPKEGFENKVFYVWFDAPIGYISMTARYTKDWRLWWQPKPEANTKIDYYQFMAKDNVPFHSVMFPSTLLGIDKGYTIGTHIMATEYLNYEDGKFSKSRGIGVFGNDVQTTNIKNDIYRFYLATARPEGQDSNFNWYDLIIRNNSELLNNLGNFINRSLVFCEKNFNSSVPNVLLLNDDLVLIALINRELKNYYLSMDKTRFRDGVKHLLTISRLGNQYMQNQQPWVLLKQSEEDKNRAGTIIGLCTNIVCLLATLLFPIMPDTARTIFKQLNTNKHNLTPDNPHMTFMMKPGHKIGKPEPLFTKIDLERADELKKQFGGTQEEQLNRAKKLTAEKTATKIGFSTVEEAEKAIADQGEKVRKLKGSGIEKSIWQPEVNILLELKKQLTLLVNLKKGNNPSEPSMTTKAATVPAASSGKNKKKK